MVREQDPYKADRPRGVLSKRDRRYLIGESDDIEPHSQRERNVRVDIRERLWNALLDFVIIRDRMQDRDLDQVFGSSYTPMPEEREENILERRDEALIALIELLYDTWSRLEDEKTFYLPVRNAIASVLWEQAREEAGEDSVVITAPEVDVSIYSTPGEAVTPEDIARRYRVHKNQLGDEQGWAKFASETEIRYLIKALDDEEEKLALLEDWFESVERDIDDEMVEVLAHAIDEEFEEQ